MKKVTLLTCLLALSLSAVAQSVISVSPVAVPNNGHNGVPADARGLSVADHAASAKSEAASAKSASSAERQTPPTAKTPPNAVQVPRTAKK